MTENQKKDELTILTQNVTNCSTDSARNATLTELRKYYNSLPNIRCEDCDISLTDTIFNCSEEEHHMVMNNSGGYLCKKHYLRSQNETAACFKGKCSQCCWWEIT
jgi:hypothetical protein